ncbi:Uncharacterized protein FKW44_012767 [Caligus rogercresseyi]|uniref:Kinesin motor domain-containing protein n=1 Tax=Caligus rogercresseyi TaxID=217165 RepID=A0A7T8K9S3_CALRO|nr:Uncharacterized protein FKW44_012767 [Caligus rogercresseyi]
MDSLSLSSLPDESHRTFLRAPDRAEISRVDPEGIAGAKKCLDFEEDCIRVYARIKPRSEEEEEEKEEEPRFRWVEREIVTEPCLSVGNGLSQRFLFSRIFESSVDQGTFFREMVRPRIVDFLTGSHQLLFAYGASSSGKTYTVQGTASQPGILPRSLDLIFNSCKPTKGLREDKESVLDLGSFLNAQDVGPEESLSASSRLRETSSIPGVDSEGMYYSLWVSFAEIYNETIHDLFERITVSNKKTRGSRKTPLKLVEDRKGCAYVKGLREICVSSADEAYQLLLIGRRNLQFAATKLNQNSSRSHCIFTVKLIRFCDLERPQLGRVHILSFCDLAGSERLKKTQTIGTRRAEAGNINASLLVLGRVMKILRDNQRLKKAAVVPFRDSKLTRLLQAFFTGMGKASMIVNISQSPYLFDETLQALKFAAITSKINYAAPSKPPRRNTRFSSILFQHKRSSTLGGRNTIVWENPPARSTLVPEKVQEEEGAREEEEDESSEEEEEDDSHYEALNNLISDLERRLREEKRKNATLESDIRMELCKEFNVMMVNRETEWQQRLKDTTERMDELSEWRLQKLESAYVVSRKRKRLDNSDEDELREKLSEVESKLEGRDIELEEKGKKRLRP